MDSYLESLVEVSEFETNSEVTKASDEGLLVTEEPTVEEESEEAAEDAETNTSEQLSEAKEEEQVSETSSVYKEGDIIKAENIKVFKTPDKNQISRNVTGNVTYLGRIGEFAIINYMRHGFGLVKGYTPDI